MTPTEPQDASRPTDPGGAARALWHWSWSLFVLPAQERRPLPFERLALWQRAAGWLRAGHSPDKVLARYEQPARTLAHMVEPRIARLRFVAGRYIDRLSPQVDTLALRVPGGAKTLALICIALLTAFAATPLSVDAQIGLGLALLSIALLLRATQSEARVTLLVGLSLLATSRYIFWRITMTLGTPGSAEWWTALGLLMAEAYTWLVLCLGYLQNARPLQRPVVELPPDRSQWPTVDILIPTYNEPLAVVRPSVLAALSLDWPAEQLRVYLLDDGHREEFRDFAASAGAQYITRPDRRGAKAGNLNHALQYSSGEFVAIFDCDHVPVRSFLTETMGAFHRDAQCGLVQTPHHFFSPDPFERNLGTFRKIPGEGSLFYGVVQDGNDLWNAAYFCGSCAVLRRSALNSIGGIAEDTVTEDAHTALRLHRKGYTSAYINKILAAGLATESLADHVNQRARWARGMAQIFRIDNPLTGRGLTWAQRLCYLNAMLHFFSGLPRLVFLTAPLAYLFFEFHVLNAGTIALAIYALPHLVQASLANSTMQRQFRHSLWNEAYEAALSWYTSLPTLLALVSPRRGRFNVTTKGGLIEHSYFDWRLATPYLALVLLNLIGVAIAIPRFLYWNTFEAETVVVNLVWTLFNLTLLGTVLGVASETRQIRRAHRIETRIAAHVQLASGEVLDATVLDFSTGGLRLSINALPSEFDETGVTINIDLAEPRGTVTVTGRKVRIDGSEVRFELRPMDLETERRYVEATFAHPQLWQDWHQSMPADRPLRSLAEVLSFGMAGYVRVGTLIGEDVRRRIRARTSAWSKA